MAKAFKILVDSDALVATTKEDDSNHKKSLAVSQKLKNSVFYITPFTIPETATVLSHKVSQRVAKKFVLKARSENFIEVPIGSGLIQEADRIFVSQNKKGTSWVDCLNAAVVKTEELDGIFSFDKFYKRLSIKYF
ncbi:MAG: type II toxin-antitoxin system VapC family toxin [bacterium]